VFKLQPELLLFEMENIFYVMFLAKYVRCVKAVVKLNAATLTHFLIV